jgi:butyrate kinase
MMKKYVLVINPGSTSTKVGLFEEENLLTSKNLSHSNEELEPFSKITDQFDFRKDIIINWLKEEGYSPEDLLAVVGRGGLLRPMPSGAYKVTKKMIDDLIIGYQGEHASNLGGLIANAIAKTQNIDAYIVDPVAVDEFEEVARISGIPQIQRKSLLHALNIRAIGHRFAKENNTNFNDLNLVIAHLGGGISIVPIKKGKMIDANNANEMGPFSPERSGGLPIGDIAKISFSEKYTEGELKKLLRGKGGLVAYLGTNDVREVVKMIDNGDEKAKLILDAMCYQIGKEIGSMATVLNGKVDAILLTGGIAYSEYVSKKIEKMVKFIAPFVVMPGEDELSALNEGTLRAIKGIEKAKIYEEELSL